MPEMLGKFLCWIGRHKMVEYTIIGFWHSRIMGYRCERCLRVESAQKGIFGKAYIKQPPVELARLYDHEWLHGRSKWL